MFEAFLLGIGAGVISSFLTGPVFFAMIKTSIERGFKAGFSLAVGVILSDIILISVVLFGSQFLAYQESFDKYIGILGGIFLVGIGIYYLFAKVVIKYQQNELVKVSKRGYLIKGFLMCILTPSTLMFWIVVSGIISVKLDFFYQKIICFIVAMVVQLSIDGLKSYFSSKLRYRIKETALSNLNKVAGVVILIFATWLIVKTYIKFY